LAPREDEFVFNIVWTGTDFTYLRLFVASQISQSKARFRFVANGCTGEQIDRMERFAARHPGRVIEVLDVSTEAIIAHGVALDRVRACRDDGRFFCFVDPDIKANSPFLSELTALFDEGYAAVTSGREVWSDDNVVPVGHVGVAGEHFFDRTGFLFGSPHLALYDRKVCDETTDRWGVGLGSAGPELSDAARSRLAELGLNYPLYDTGKIFNALLQADGHRLTHRDIPQLVHIGGMSHFLSPPGGYITLDDGEQAPDFARWGLTDRFHVTKFTARTLRELSEGRPVPAIPPEADPAMAGKLALVQNEMAELFSTYASW
jgi:hypothetical protein